MLFRKRKRHPYDARNAMQLDNETPSIGAWVAVSAWLSALVMAVIVFANHPQSKHMFQFSKRAPVETAQEEVEPEIDYEAEWDVHHPDFKIREDKTDDKEDSSK